MALSKRRRPRATTPTSNFQVDLSGHGGNYEDMEDMSTWHDEEIESDDDHQVDEDDPDDSSLEETVDAKKLRMAKEYLNQIQAEEMVDDAHHDTIGTRLAHERLRTMGLWHTSLAEAIVSGVEGRRRHIETILRSASFVESSSTQSYDDSSPETCAKTWLDAKYVTYHRGHDLTPTCVALSSDGSRAFSGAKDGSILQWDVDSAKKLASVTTATTRRTDNEGGGGGGSNRDVLAMTTSHDDRYLAVGGRDNCVRIFDIRTLPSGAATQPIAIMEGHKKAVTCLSFRHRTLDLYSGSDDRCIRRYDLHSMTYVETLYGHQSPVTSIHCANKNRPVSVARDRTVRLWKVEEDSHLVFRPGGDVGSAECVSVIQDGWFVTGHDDGRLALWKEEKKRPVGNVIVAAHGCSSTGGVPRGVLCCDAIGNSDVLATGSNDGYLRLWKVNTQEKGAGMQALDKIPVHGHINSVAVGPDGKFCVAAVGQEPRLGRWDRVPRAKNRFAIIKLSQVESHSD